MPIYIKLCAVLVLWYISLFFHISPLWPGELCLWHFPEADQVGSTWRRCCLMCQTCLLPPFPRPYPNILCFLWEPGWMTGLVPCWPMGRAAIYRQSVSGAWSKYNQFIFTNTIIWQLNKSIARLWKAALNPSHGCKVSNCFLIIDEKITTVTI